MAVISVHGAPTPIGPVRSVRTDWPAPFDNLDPVNLMTSKARVEQGAHFAAPLTDNTPISGAEQDLGACYRMPTFLDDWYNRIHIFPGLLEMGNLLSSQVRTVEVWNAYFDPNLLSELQISGGEGIFLVQPEDPPTYFAALESCIYTVTIETNVPPVIDAAYLFIFENEQPTLRITGRRVVLWPFVPETGHNETMEWRTDILKSFNKEQRLALRAEPRQAFQHSFLLDEYQFSRAKAISTQWAHRVYGIPVWAELTRLHNLQAGQTFIDFDTSFADYRDNDLVVLWESDMRVVAVEILEVEPTGVHLKLPLEEAWPMCYVAPLRFARTLSGVEFVRTHNEQITATALFDVSQNKDLSSDGSLPIYRGKPVMTDRSATVSDLSERIARAVDVFDNGSGPITIDVQSSFVRNQQMIAFDKQNKEAIWNLRRWIHARKGRQVGFWLPSWNKDIDILEDVGSAATALTIRPLGFPLYYGVKDIMVQLRNGSRFFRRVLSSSTNQDGNEVLSLDENFGTAFAVTDIAFTCFITHCRFDSDRITFNHSEFGRATVVIPVVETPE